MIQNSHSPARATSHGAARSTVHSAARGASHGASHGAARSTVQRSRRLAGGFKTASLKVAGKAAVLGMALLIATPLDALACTQVYVGPKLTDTGNVYIGRSEDYAPRHPKAFGIQLPRTNPTFSSGESNFSWTFTGTTLRHTYVRDLPSGWNNRTDAYAEAGTNEKGVSVSATLTTDYNDKIAAVDPIGKSTDYSAPASASTGIGEYNIADVVLGCAKSAREGVKLLGSIIEKHGAYDNNQVIIADAKETWLFSMVSGHQWVAMNLTAVAPDKASVNPNIGRLKFKVDLANESLCLHSKDLEQTAKNAGSAKYFADGSFDVASSYGAENPLPGQWTRYAQGRDYFGTPLKEGEYTFRSLEEAGEDDPIGVTSVTDPQLFFTPGKKQISLFDAQKALCARGEGTKQFDANKNLDLYAIGNETTVEGHMYQIRQNMSADIATIQWQNLSRCEFGVFVPSYSALLTEVNTKLYPINGQWSEAPKSLPGAEEPEEDDVKAAMNAAADDGSLEYVAMNINTLAFNNRSTLAGPVRQYLNALQKQLNEQHKAIDALMQKTPAEKRSELANLAHNNASEQVYAKTYKLLNEMRSYLTKHGQAQASSQTRSTNPTPFVPSDWDAATGDLKDPLRYQATIAEAYNAPAIKAVTGADNVVAGKKLTLSVDANIVDGDEKSKDKLSYTWYAADGTTKLGEGVSLTTDAPAKPGSYTYYVVAKNTVNGKTTRQEIALNVTVAPASGDDVQPGNSTKPSDSAGSTQPHATTKPDATKPDATKPDATKPHKTVKPSNIKKQMPKTGDAANMPAAAFVALAGVAVSLYAYDRKQHASR